MYYRDLRNLGRSLLKLYYVPVHRIFTIQKVKWMAITIIGAAIIDILARPVDGKVFEQGSWPVQDMRMDIGGDAANEAIVLSGLGKKVYLQTVLGEDMAGRMILKRLRERGVCVSGSCVSRDMVTGINTVLIQEDGERSFLTNPNGSLRKLGMEHIHIPFEEDTEILCLASIFVSPLLTVREMEQIFSAAKSQGITVCADMTKCKNQETAAELAPAFRYVDYLLPNEAEAKLLTRKNSVEEASFSRGDQMWKERLLCGRSKGILLGAGQRAGPMCGYHRRGR